MGILGLILMFVLTLAGVFSFGSELVDVPAAMVVILFPLGALMASFGTTGLRALFIPLRKRADRPALMLALSVYERGQSFAIASGVVGAFTGFVMLLKRVDDPLALGPGLAMFLILIFYGLFLSYGVFFPITVALKRKLENM